MCPNSTVRMIKSHNSIDQCHGSNDQNPTFEGPGSSIQFANPKLRMVESRFAIARVHTSKEHVPQSKWSDPTFRMVEFIVTTAHNSQCTSHFPQTPHRLVHGAKPYQSRGVGAEPAFAIHLAHRLRVELHNPTLLWAERSRLRWFDFVV